MGKRRLKREVEEHRNHLADAFAGYLTAMHQNRLPRPGSYIQRDDWEYLDGETEETQTRRFGAEGEDIPTLTRSSLSASTQRAGARVG